MANKKSYTKKERDEMLRYQLDEEAYEEFKKMGPKPSADGTRYIFPDPMAPGVTRAEFRGDGPKGDAWKARLAELQKQSAEREQKRKARELADYNKTIRGQETVTEKEKREAKEKSESEKNEKEKTQEKLQNGETTTSSTPAPAGPVEGSGTQINPNPTTSSSASAQQTSVTYVRNRAGTPIAVPTINGKPVDPKDQSSMTRVHELNRQATSRSYRDYVREREREEIDRLRKSSEESSRQALERKDKYNKSNYDQAKFSTREGWANLGLRDGEKSGASAAEGSAERKSFDDRVAAIREGLKRAGSKYMRGGEVSGIGRMFEESIQKGTLSDKQLEAMEKKIGRWDRTIAERQAFADRESAILAEQSARRYLGEDGRGLGKEAAIALADARRLKAVQDAAKGLTDVKTPESDRLTHSETLLRHGIDAEAIGRNLVENDPKMRERFVKEAGGKTDAATTSGLYRNYGLASVGSAKNYNDLISGPMTSGGVTISTPAVAEASRNRQAEALKAKTQDNGTGGLDTLKPIDYFDLNNRADKEIARLDREEERRRTGVGMSNKGWLRGLWDELVGGSDNKSVISDDLGLQMASKGGFARRAVNATALSPKGR